MAESALGDRWQEELVARVADTLPPHVLRYFHAGAREGITAAEASAAWRDVRFWPHVLRDVRQPSVTSSLLGTPVSAPIGIAPTSLQRLGHPEGELAMARAAARTDTLLVVSSNAGTTFEEIADTGAAWWLQAYVTADRDLIAPTFERAARAGARAIVLTVDTPMPGPKYDLDDEAFGDLSHAYGVNHPDVVRGAVPGSEHAADLGPGDITWLQDLTGLPVVVKGVLRADDAQACVAAGAAAVWVSNHGGRQLDRSVSTARALPPVSEAVAGAAEVYVDGGVTSGLDMLAALASGARAVFLGRLPLFALCDRGTEGVVDALLALRAELVSALALSGCSQLSDAPGIIAPPVTNRL